MFSRFLLDVFCLIGILAVAFADVTGDKSAWKCITAKADTSLSPSNSVQWGQSNCTNSENPDAEPLLVVNVVHIDLNSPDVKLSPAVSTDATQPLQPINSIAAGNPKRNFVAGINGGYFWRTDITPFWLDDVCRGKIRAQAEKPADPAKPNYGIHDGLIKINGETLGSNCDCWGYSRPAIINDADDNWHVNVVQRGQQGPANIQNGLAAGPNLVSYNASTWATFVDIPSDDDNINIHEHAANTAVGVIFDTTTGKAQKMMLVTTDGSDECGRLDESCGINAPNLASLMKDHFGAHQAMSMDQGGSTTMWIKAMEGTTAGNSSNGDGVVSYSGGGARNVANGFFVEIV